MNAFGRGDGLEGALAKPYAVICRRGASPPSANRIGGRPHNVVVFMNVSSIAQSGHVRHTAWRLLLALAIAVCAAVPVHSSLSAGGCGGV